MLRQWLGLWDNKKTFRLRMLWLLGLNASLGLLFEITLWWSQTRGDKLMLSAYLTSSLIHSCVYGVMFGTAMPYLGERLAALRFPWSWAWAVSSLALVAAVATLVVQSCLRVLGYLPEERFWAEFRYKSLMVLFISLVIASCIRAYDKVREQIQSTNLQLRTQQLEKERALKLATEARLSLLESRLNPHFLFNTLNSISALISEDPMLAEQMLQRLATLLRASLDICAQSYVPLRKELDLVIDYTEIERARLGDRLSLSIDVPPELEWLAVPPMTLQPLVENSIKYSISPRPRGGQLSVSARRQTGQLVLNVWDDGPGFLLDAIPAGHSLDNLQARLKTMFCDNAELSIFSNGAGTTVTVRLPLVVSEAT